MVQEEDHDGDDFDVPPVPPSSLSLLSDNVVAYVAGFVVRKIRRTLKCADCLQHLLLQSGDPIRGFDLIDIRDNGGLLRPSSTVVRLCAACELHLRSLTSEDFTKRHLREKVVVNVVQEAVGFPNDHSSGLNPHCLQLARLVVSTFFDIMCFHRAKKTTERAQGNSIRAKLTKTILFAHQ